MLRCRKRTLRSCVQRLTYRQRSVIPGHLMNTSAFKPYRPVLFFLIVLAIACAIRIHLLPVPLERDEGEYAYSGQLILQGIPPFSQSYNMKMPGIYVAYAAILTCFGQTTTGIHFGLLLINILSSLAMFLLGRRLYNPLVGCASGSAFAVMTLCSSVLGLSANAEHFVVLFVLLGCLSLLETLDKERSLFAFLAGLSFGACVLMKQHGAAFALFGFLCVLAGTFSAHRGRIKKPAMFALVYCAGVLVPFFVVCLWLWCAGVFGSFWFWTFTYARAYVTQIPLWVGAHIFYDQMGHITASSPALWLLAMLGLVSLLFDRNSKWKTGGVLLFLLLSFVSICPGFYFREHYFILVLPVVSLLCGKGVAFALSPFVKRPALLFSLFCLVVGGAVAIPLFAEKAILFESAPMRVSRLIYGPNPFPESCVIADSLRAWTSPADKIGILGSEPQIFFYAHRRSASGYIYTYALMEKQPFALHMQDEMIRQIEAAAPRYLVYVNVDVSWLVRPDSYTRIFQWFNQYQRSMYEVAGVADIVSDRKTVFVWGNEVKKYAPQSSAWIAVFKRRVAGQ